jgi:hypothetical protein
MHITVKSLIVGFIVTLVVAVWRVFWSTAKHLNEQRKNGRD